MTEQKLTYFTTYKAALARSSLNTRNPKAMAYVIDGEVKYLAVLDEYKSKRITIRWFIDKNDLCYYETLINL